MVLPKKLNDEINDFLSKESITRSDLVHEAVSDYIYLKRLRKLRNKMLIHSKDNNVFTDEDVFGLVS